MRQIGLERHSDLASFKAEDQPEAHTLKELKSLLSDPNAVRINMLRGTIAWTPEMLYSVMGVKPPQPETVTISREFAEHVLEQDLYYDSRYSDPLLTIEQAAQLKSALNS